MRLCAGEKLMLGLAEAETLCSGEGEPVGLAAPVRDTVGECVTDTEPEALLVKGSVVPMAVPVGLASQVRVAPEGLAPSDALETTVVEPVTLPEGDTLAEGVSVADRHSVAEPEGEGDAVLAMLSERDTVEVTDTEEVGEGPTLEDGVTNGLRDTLTVRDRLRVTQLEAVGEAERHRVGGWEGQGEALWERVCAGEALPLKVLGAVVAPEVGVDVSDWVTVEDRVREARGETLREGE